MDQNYPELNTESDTTLEQPDLDQLRQDRLDRNRKFLQSVSGSTAARVLSQDQGCSDVREAAAVKIQKNWKRAMAQKVYVTMLYERYMKEEEEQNKKMRHQVEEGELLVENHELEVLLDDHKTTRRNTERRLISKVITIQRFWKAYQERKKNEQLMSSSIANKLSAKSNEVRGHKIDQVNSLQSNTQFNQENSYSDNPNANNVRAGATDNTTDTCFVNPLSDDTSNVVTATSSVVNVFKQLPRETVEDYQRRVRKQSLLSQAQQFIQLKKENSNALPFNAHVYDRQEEASSGFECKHRARMDTVVTVSGDCATCDLNRNLNNENHAKVDGNDKPIPRIEIGEIVTKNKSAGASPESISYTETKGSNSDNSTEKGDKTIGAFDVYNIETALPDLDWKNLEEKLIAARKEEDERLKVG